MSDTSTRANAAWLLAAVAAAVGTSLLAARVAFSAEYVAPFDAQTLAFWTPRLRDATLFPHDLMADYFQSVAPLGYRALFWVLLRFGLESLTIIKLLPLVIVPVTAVYSYRLTFALIPRASAACLASVLLTETIWLNHDVSSGTPRSFVYPLLAAFLYYMARRRWIGIAITTVGLALLYPPVALVALGVLTLDVLRLRHEWRPVIVPTAGIIGVSLAILSVEAALSSQFGPTLRLADAHTVPELGPRGFFAWFSGPPAFWLIAHRSGLMPLAMAWPLFAGFAVPMLVWGRDLPSRTTPAIRVLGQTTVAAVLLFGLGHLVAFRLYQPSRFTMHVAHILLAVSAAIAWVALADWLMARKPRAGAIAAALVATVAAVGLPALGLPRPLPDTGYQVGLEPELYKFFAAQPVDIVIASLSREAQLIPSFSKRTVLVARRFGLPWHRGYYAAFRERTSDVINAQYATDPSELRRVTLKYGITWWLIDVDAFSTHYLPDPRWTEQYAEVAGAAQATLESGAKPVLTSLMERCVGFKNDQVVVLSAACAIGK